MGKLKLFFITLILCSLVQTSTSYSQVGWFQQNVASSNSENVNLTRVQFVSEEIVITIGGGGGVIKRSTDGGVNWTDVLSNTGGTIWGLDFVDEQTGYASGANGQLYKTIDAGLNWTPQISNTNVRLWSISFLNENTGFASGSNGIVLKTTNAGSNWNSSNVINGGELRKIIFIDEDIAFTAGYNGIHKTSDGGNNWELSFNIGLGLTDIEYRDGNLIAVGNGVILRSSNLGNSWTTRSVNHLYVGVTFVTNDKIIATGYQGTIAVSNDKGNNWNISSNNFTGLPLACPSFYNETKGVIVGGDGYNENGKRGIIVWSNNGGENWVISLINNNQSVQDLNFRSVFLTNQNTIWATTTNGTLLKSENGGEDWTSNNVTTFSINKIRFYDENIGVMACNSGRIIHTTNGGLNWITSNVGVSTTLHDIVFKSDIEFFVCGSNGYIFRTTDGGQSYSQISLGNSNNFRTIDILENLVITAGANGKIFLSNDNAVTWTAINTDFSNYIYGLQILDENTFVICGSNGMIRKTTNLGNSWIIQSSGIINDFNALYYLNENIGYVVGNNGVVLKTLSQGSLWEIQNSTTSKSLFDVHFYSESVGNAVGNSNIILRTEDGGLSTNLTQYVGEVPQQHLLSQNYPNPFNPTTKIKFTLPSSGITKLDIYNIQGRLIETLVNEPLNEGIYEFSFDAKNLPSGIYFYRLTTNTFSETKKMTLIK